MSSLRDLQASVAARQEEVRQRDSLIQHLEKEVRARDAQIRGMQAELDKFRQILKPVTQQLAGNVSAAAEEADYKAAPGRDGHDKSAASLGLSTLGSGLSKAKEKVEGVAARMKRIAISAEPSKRVANPKDLNITRIDKSDR